MRVPRAGKVAGIVLLLAAAAGLAAVYTRNSRDVTTSSEEAYQAWREAVENERRFYFKDARVGFARALQLDPQFAMAMIGLARNSEKEQRVSLTNRANRERGRLTDHERLHVDLMLAANDHDEAKFASIARTIHEKYPSDIRAATVCAKLEIDAGRTERALQIFGDLLAREPNSADAYNQIGYYYGYRGDYDKAIENIKKYQFMAPDQANPYDSLGEIMAFSGRYDEAIENLNKALALKPDFGASYEHLGLAYEGKGDVEAAVKNYIRASEEAINDGGRIESLMRALRVSSMAGNLPLTRQIAERCLQMPHDRSLDPNWEVGRELIRGVVALLEGRLDEADKGLTVAKQKWDVLFTKNNKGTTYKPYWPYWQLMMARTRVAQGRADEAIALYEQMVNPPNTWSDFESRRWVYEGRAALAELVAKKGDLVRADKLLAENHRWNPSWAPSRPAELAVAEMHRERVQAASR
ncbi:MAG TPA: tetratricopeptide repeat protein [Thermoanaerobaculia bacterium]|nr:tetratricopeptide repeat protein [Thermoanaerobaculia bacterium]